MSTERHMTPIPYGHFSPSCSKPEVIHEYPGQLGRPKAPIHASESRTKQRILMATLTGLFMLSASMLAIPVVANLIPQEVTQTLQDGMEVTIKAVAIMDDERLRWWCVIGAFCGAWISVGAFRPSDWYAGIAKWGTSFLASICFVPFLIEWWGWRMVSTVALASSCMGAIMAWSLIHMCIPIITHIASTRIIMAIRGILGSPPETKESETPTVKLNP